VEVEAVGDMEAVMVATTDIKADPSHTTTMVIATTNLTTTTMAAITTVPAMSLGIWGLLAEIKVLVIGADLMLLAMVWEGQALLVAQEEREWALLLLVQAPEQVLLLVA
jgi:hypothetical protein